MNYLKIAGMTTAMLMIPAGLALAKDGQASSSRGFNFFQNLQTSLGITVGKHEVDADAHESANVEVNENDKHSTSTPYMSGEKKGIEKHYGTTTPPGHVATSTDNENGHKGGIIAFLRWFFSLPATTTVGDIRADIGATSTASNSGLGFFAHLFSFLHIGN